MKIRTFGPCAVGYHENCAIVIVGSADKEASACDCPCHSKDAEAVSALKPQPCPSCAAKDRRIAELEADLRKLEAASGELIDALVGQGTAGAIDSVRLENAHSAVYYLVSKEGRETQNNP